MNIFLQTSNFYQNQFGFYGRKPNLNKLKNEVGTITKELTEFQKKKTARDAQILDLLLKGVSRKEISEKLDVSPAIVNSVAENNTVFQNSIKERTQRILKKIKKGVPTEQIAKEEGVHPTTVTRTAQKNNINIRDYNNKNNTYIRNKNILKDIKEGISLKILSKKYNLSIGRIRKIKSEFGLTKTYNWINDPMKFRFDEIKKQSENITLLREKYRKFKLGERSSKILEEMLEVIDTLKDNIQEFKSRFN